jgi:hypothetical protein
MVILIFKAITFGSLIIYMWKNHDSFFFFFKFKQVPYNPNSLFH